MRIKGFQKLIDKIRRKKIKCILEDDIIISGEKPNTSRKININKTIVIVDGFYYSGSSAVVDFLSEFSNTFVLGFSEVYAAKKRRHSKEMTFFRNPFSLFNLIKMFKSGTLLEKDLAIKSFIYHFYSYYDNNKEMISDKFLNIMINFLENVLDLDKQTIEFMRDKRYPYIWNSSENTYENCSFMQGEDISQYLFYKFKSLSVYDFDCLVSDLLYDFFEIVGEGGNENKDVLVFDQLSFLDKDMLAYLNFYMNERPIKEICVYRDPRDQFLSAFRNDYEGWLKRTCENYVNYYNWACVRKIKCLTENRLCIKFEDLVLNYDEVTTKIMNFIGIKKENHTEPKSVFDPDISKINIGAYKNFIDKNFMKQVEENLQEYCYYPKKASILKKEKELVKGLSNG